MSNKVINSVPDQDPGQVLLDLERFEDSTHTASEFAFFAGPFGVSKLSQISESESTSTSPQLDGTSVLPGNWMLNMDELLNQNSSIEFCDILNTSDDISPDGMKPWGSFEPNMELVDLWQSDRNHPQPDLSSIFSASSSEAWTILSHYRDTIVPLISPMAQEAPWASLVMPCAISTLGEITMNGKAGHARLALLNALLSTSAFYLGQHSTMELEYWKETGDSYLKRAQQHFLQCMEEVWESTIKKSKYKEIVMAILSLSTAHVCEPELK